jgi:hypothetical protein
VLNSYTGFGEVDCETKRKASAQESTIRPKSIRGLEEVRGEGEICCKGAKKQFPKDSTRQFIGQLITKLYLIISNELEN